MSDDVRSVRGSRVLHAPPGDGGMGSDVHLRRTPAPLPTRAEYDALAARVTELERLVAELVEHLHNERQRR
jgi:hypothetical protein